MRFVSLILLILWPAFATAQTDAHQRLVDLVEGHVLPGYAQLVEKTEALVETAEAQCAPTDPELRAAFGEAWDAWILVSHLRFGPSEVDNRAFKMGYWPDKRGKVLQALRRLTTAEIPVVEDPAAFAEYSIAAHGFTALEFLLYEPSLTVDTPYGCALIQVIAGDIAANAAAIYGDWAGEYGADFVSNGPLSAYRTEAEAVSVLYSAITTGLEFSTAARLAQPMGSFEKPRPLRAEARRSGRSWRHVKLSLEATEDLALLMAAGHPDVQAAMTAAFDRAETQGEELDDPVFAMVESPIGRLKVEILQQDVQAAADAVRLHLGGL
ncbi:MAG: imelysin family protein, partial [Mangrovicoccus sp.]